MTNEDYTKVTELISLFKNGEELYKRNPLFNMCAISYAQGANIYDLFEILLKACDDTTKAFEQYVIRDTRSLTNV